MRVRVRVKVRVWVRVRVRVKIRVRVWVWVRVRVLRASTCPVARGASRAATPSLTPPAPRSLRWPPSSEQPVVPSANQRA